MIRREPETVFALPVSLKQIAALIKQMSSEDRQQLLKLAPELQKDVIQTERTIENARGTVKFLKEEVLQAIGANRSVSTSRS